MPEIGDIISSKLIGRKEGRRLTWVLCPVCGKGHWIGLNDVKRPTYTGRCSKCALKLGKHSKGKNSRWVSPQGYVYIYLKPHDFFYPMTTDGVVSEHRLVVAKALKRNLHGWEIVHHKGTKFPKGSREDKQDNRYPENLQLVTDDRHKQITILENKIKYLENKVMLLEAENVRLGQQLTTKSI